MEKKISEQRKALYRKDILAGEKKDVGDEIKGWVKSKVTSAVLWLGHKVSILFPDKDKEVLTAFKNAVSGNIKDYEEGVRNYIKDNFSYLPKESKIYKDVIEKAGRFEQISKEDLENLKIANNANHLVYAEVTHNFINEEKYIYNEKLDEMINSNLIPESERYNLSFEAIVKDKSGKNIEHDFILSEEERKLIKDELIKNKEAFDKEINDHKLKKSTQEFINEEKSEYDKKLDYIINSNLISKSEITKLRFEEIVKNKTGKNIKDLIVLSEKEKKEIKDELIKNKEDFDKKISYKRVQLLQHRISDHEKKYNLKLEEAIKLGFISENDKEELSFKSVLKKGEGYYLDLVLVEHKKINDVNEILNADVDSIKNNLNKVILKNQTDTSKFIEFQRTRYENILQLAKEKGVDVGLVEFDNILQGFVPEGQEFSEFVISKEDQAQFKKAVDNQIQAMNAEIQRMVTEEEIILKNREDTSKFIEFQRTRYENILQLAKEKGVDVGLVEFDNILQGFVPEGQELSKFVISKEDQAQFKKAVDNQIKAMNVEIQRLEEG